MWTYRTCEGGGGGLRAHIDCKSLITKLFAIALICLKSWFLEWVNVAAILVRSVCLCVREKLWNSIVTTEVFSRGDPGIHARQRVLCRGKQVVLQKGWQNESTGTPIEGRTFMVTENNFSKSSCRNPDNRKNPENRDRIGNYGQLEKRIKLRRSYWRFLEFWIG